MLLSLLGADPSFEAPFEAPLERIQEVCESLESNSHEMKRINDRLDRWEGGVQAIWKALTGAFYLIRWLCFALIAVCVARTVHDLCYAVAAVRGKPS